jgi:hypothetical protein
MESGFALMDGCSVDRIEKARASVVVATETRQAVSEMPITHKEPGDSEFLSSGMHRMEIVCRKYASILLGERHLPRENAVFSRQRAEINAAGQTHPEKTTS